MGDIEHFIKEKLSVEEKNNDYETRQDEEIEENENQIEVEENPIEDEIEDQSDKEKEDMGSEDEEEYRVFFSNGPAPKSSKC